MNELSSNHKTFYSFRVNSHVVFKLFWPLASFSSLVATTELFYFSVFFSMIIIIYLGLPILLLVHINFADNDLQTEHGVALKTIPWNTGDNFASIQLLWVKELCACTVRHVLKIIPLIKWSSHQIVASFVFTISVRIRFFFGVIVYRSLPCFECLYAVYLCFEG